MKILIITLAGIGDALMFTPSVIKLKEFYPDSEIDVLTMFKGTENIYSGIPQINKIIFFDFLREKIVKSLSFVLSLRGKYDISFNVYPANRKEYNIISFLIGARKRAAVSYLRKDFSNLGFLNNVVCRENDLLHNVEENINLVAKVSGKKIDNIPELFFPLSNEDEKIAQNVLSESSVKNDELVIGFHPGCAILKNHIKRRWEPERFSALGKKLIDDFNAKILVFGGPEEKELKETVRDGINSPRAVIINTGSLSQSAAVMKRCNVFVTNDSSLMHVAGALKLKTVVAIGPTNVNYIHPWRTEYRIASLNLDCAPCFFYSPKPLTCSRTDVQFKSIKELDVNIVYDAVKSFIDDGKDLK
jgi:heptosyltransferase-2